MTSRHGEPSPRSQTFRGGYATTAVPHFRAPCLTCGSDLRFGSDRLTGLSIETCDRCGYSRRMQVAPVVPVVIPPEMLGHGPGYSPPGSPPPAYVYHAATCAMCGNPFETVRSDVCGQKCRNRRDRENGKARTQTRYVRKGRAA